MIRGTDWEAYLQLITDEEQAKEERDKLKEWNNDDGEQVDELFMTRPNPVSFNADNGDIFHAMADAYAINNKQSVFDSQATFHTDSMEVEEKSVDTTDM
ncbi:hypothetical protein [Pseudobutyrivibrio sp. MD2005]|uniref:hypothetical protein n=1 Tax=Pseudobutyrivibrio sp. MD2005 TaxID=1410616 RepID=UPI00048251B6|nr:hypothetical protein [Pseudobutyrivibrio sp. MD2005]